jgi:hypothetical protein
MTLLVAAIAATVTAIVESTITPYLRVGDAQPHLVFVFASRLDRRGRARQRPGVGLRRGPRPRHARNAPLGSTAFALLIAVGITAVLARSLHRIRPVVAIIATALLSLLYSMTLIVLFSVLRPAAALTDPLRFIAPGVVYDVILAAILGPLAVSMHDRFAQDEERAPR